MQEAPRGTFSATLSPRERRLAGRLEGFGDIVFGFAISQCALQLPTVRGHVDLAHPLGLLLYFATFAIVASLWLIYHRLMSGSFLPGGVDLFGAFAYLAIVSLFPYAMYAIAHGVGTLEAARLAFLAYAALYAAMTALAAVLTIRNLRRGWSSLDARERDAVWIDFIRRCVVFAAMSLASIVDLGFGPAAAGATLLVIPLAIRLARLRFKHAPSPGRARVAP